MSSRLSRPAFDPVPVISRTSPWLEVTLRLRWPRPWPFFRHAGEKNFVHCNYPFPPFLVLSCLLPLALPATLCAQPPLRFTEVTNSSGIDFVHTIGDDKMTNIVEASGVGCAMLDYDGDGWLDIYLVNGVHLDGVSDPTVADKQKLKDATDRLYRNRGDGTFEDVTLKAGILPGGYGMGVVAGDYNNDGRPDIYVSNYGPNRLYKNAGNGRFEEVAQDAGVADPNFSVGVVFVDYDCDGDLDLYVGNYLKFDPDYKVAYESDTFPGPSAYDAQVNSLYRNEGNGKFSNVTDEAQLGQHLGRTMGVGVFDFDDDGQPDLFVPNDAMENFFFRNTGNGRFEEMALMTNVAFGMNGEARGAMGAEIGDVNGDKLVDLFVPDFTYTCLYINLGDGFFEDQARQAGIAALCDQHVSWGAALADLDLDSDLDLYVSNGDANHLIGHENLLFVNDGRGVFAEVSREAGLAGQKKGVSRGVVAGDFDNDGDLDLLVSQLNDAPVLLRNDTPRDGRHWLMLNLIGAAGHSNHDAIGARVRCSLPDSPGQLMRYRSSSGSYMSGHDPRLHFGLGSLAVVPEIEIRWPDGSLQTLRNIAADQVLTVKQDQP